MPFIGKSSADGNNNELLDAITTSNTATYNLTKDSVAYAPVSAQSLTVSLNGVTQAPISAYTISGSTIVFASALTSNDVIDYIIALEGQTKSIDANNIEAGTITPSMLAADAVTQAKIADDAVDEARLQISNSGTNGYALTYQSGNTGKLTWAALAGGAVSDGSITVAKLATGTLKTPGTNNIAIGTNALVDGSLSGQYNTGIGLNSLKENEAGEYNTALGTNSMAASTGADYNTGLGYGALYTTSTGQYNVASGHQAMWLNTTGSYNVAIGAVAAYDNTEAQYGTALGYAALYNNTTGNYNTCLGVQTGYSNTTGYNQVFVGGFAGYAATDGNSNTCVGYTAGYGLTTGDNNIIIGSSAGRAASPSGNITTGDNIMCLGNNNITDFYCADTSISSSDERDKAEITDFTHGLSWIKKMRPVTYKWDKRSWYLGENEEDVTAVTRDGSKKKSKVNIGLIAQEVLAIEQADSFSSSKDNMLVVNLNEDDTGYGIKYERIVPILINAIKELETRLAALEG